MNSVSWDYYDRYEMVINKYMPSLGEGDTMASQICTAVNKLIYKWYNDGDVYDNVHSGISGWCNDLSSYANWLAEYTQASGILEQIYDCYNDDTYEQILKELADTLLDDEDLEHWSRIPKHGSIYDCDGQFEFREDYDDDEDDW